MNKAFVIWLFIIVLFPDFTYAQNYHTTNYSMKDGMPSNSVRSIFKDSKGYLWIGTDGGLCRFDGKKFKIYTSREGFRGSNIWSISEDDKRQMWFGDYGGGLWKYDGNRFFHFTETDSLVNNNVRCLHYSKTWNLLFVGTQFGLTVYDGKSFMNYTGEEIGINHDPYIMGFIEQDTVIDIYTFSHENLTYHPKSQKLLPRSEKLSFAKGSFLSGYKKSDGTTLLAYRNGFFATNNIDTLVDISVATESPENKDIGQVFGFAEDRFKNVWLASWEPNPKNPGGLFLFDGGKVVKKNNILGKNPLSGWSVCYDEKQRILWFGTLDMGLFKIQESQFENLKPEAYGSESLQVVDLLFDQGKNMYILSKKNLVISKTGGAIEKIPIRDFYNAYRKFLDNTSQKDNRVVDYKSFRKVLDFRGMAFQNDSVLWVSGLPGIFRIELTTYSIDCFDKSGYGVGKPLFDASGCLFLANNWGLFEVYENTAVNDNHSPQRKIIPGPKDITGVVADKDHKVWWMTSWSSGLLGGWDTKYINYNQTNSPFENHLNAICMDDNGHLIIGANNGKVYITEPKDDTLFITRTLDPEDGISGNSIEWLEIDKYRQLWIGTNTDLNRCDLHDLLENGKLEIFNFNEKEGYLEPDVNVSIKDTAGNIWLGTDYGLTKIHVSKPGIDSGWMTGINLSKYEVNGKNFPIDSGTPIRLKHNRNYLTFSFDVINYINPNKDHFRYKLDGLDQGWTAWSNERQAAYPYLPPGDFIFRVEGKNLNTGVHYEPLEMKMEIKSPFWQTWWFLGFLGIVISLLLWAFFRIRINKTKERERRKAEISKQLAELEMKALLAQMNPHFTFNAINSIQNYILDNDVDKALAYLSDFSKIIRQTLENASKEFITLAEEIDYIQRYLNLEQMRFDRQFSYFIETDTHIDPETTQIPPMILQPYVENAIKHGLRHKVGKGTLKIEFSLAGQEILKCIIEDNGIGRAASQVINQKIRNNHNGAGMVITKNRIDKLKKVYNSDVFTVQVIDLTDEKEQPTGTRVEIKLPVNQ